MPVEIATKQLHELLRDYYPHSGGIAYIVSPFIRNEILIDILGKRHDEATVVVTSWRLPHLFTGVSSLDVYETCKDAGWTLYINDRLHAKVYSDSLRSAWVGSANLTGRGLGSVSPSNLELLAFLPDIAPEFRMWIHSITSSSRLVSQELFEWFSDWLKAHPGPEVPSFEDEVPPPVDKDPFLISQLPATESPERLWEILRHWHSDVLDMDELATAEHDITLYGPVPTDSYENFRTTLGEAFFKHPFVRALALQITHDGLRFGAVKEWVQSNCRDVPVPYRWELTSRVQALYSWLSALAPTEFEISRPRHSQVIRKTGSRAD